MTRDGKKWQGPLHGWSCGSCHQIGLHRSWLEAEAGLKAHLKVTGHASLGSERFGNFGDYKLKRN